MNESQGEPQTDTSSLYSSTFAQVIFVNVGKLYMTDIPVKCNYTLTPQINAHKKDWIGIFKVGWNTARDYHTFVWAPLPKEDSQVERQQQVTFEAYYLPKDNNDFYQFCYVTHKGEIRGASTPFGFRLANSSMSDHMDSDSSQEMLIITTQDKLEESEREKDELKGNNLRLVEENTTLKKKIEELEAQAEQDKQEHSGALEMNKKDMMAFEKQMLEQKVDNEVEMKAQSEKTEQLRKELTEKEAASLSAQKETQDLRARLESAQSSVEKSKEKYEKAVDKVKQLQQETEMLKMEISAKETELTSLSQTKQQMASELRIVQDNLALVQFDFDIQKKESEKMTEHLKKTAEIEIQLQNQTAEICHLRRALSDYEKLKASNSNTAQDLRARLESAQSSVEKSKEKYEKAVDKVKQLQQETEMLKMEISAKETELTSLSQTKQQMASELRIVQDNLDLVRFDFDIQKKENEKLTERLKKTAAIEIQLQNQTAEICHLRHALSDYEKLKASNSNTAQLQAQIENLRQCLKGTEEQFEMAKQRQVQTTAELRAAEADREKSDANLRSAHQDIQHWKSKFQKIDQIFSKSEGSAEGGSIADHPLQKEIASLKAKLLTGKSCYVQKYKECQRLHKQIDKLKALEDKNKCHSPIKEIVEITENAETAASSGGVSVQQPETDLAEITANLGDRAEKAVVRFTEIERELEDKTHIVDIRTMEVTALQEEIKKLNKKIDELRLGSNHRSGAFQLEHPNPYSLTVPKVHSGHSGLMFGNPYSECDVKRSQTGASIDYVQNLDGKENSQEAEEEHIDSQKCPVCEVLFPLNLEDFDFEQHVLKHFVYECPVCQRTFPENRQAAYEDHVQSHFLEVN